MMTRSQLQGRRLQDRWPAPVFAVLLLLGAVAVSGCSATHSLIDNLPATAGGLPQGTPERPATPAQYPTVHGVPPARRDDPLSEAEKKRLKDELIASRNRAARQATGAESTDGGSTGSTAGGARNP